MDPLPRPVLEYADSAPPAPRPFAYFFVAVAGIAAITPFVPLLHGVSPLRDILTHGTVDVLWRLLLPLFAAIPLLVWKLLGCRRPQPGPTRTWTGYALAALFALPSINLLALLLRPMVGDPHSATQFIPAFWLRVALVTAVGVLGILLCVRLGRRGLHQEAVEALLMSSYVAAGVDCMVRFGYVPQLTVGFYLTAIACSGLFVDLCLLTALTLRRSEPGA